MTALIILLSLTIFLISVTEVTGRRYATRRADEAIDDASVRLLYDRYLCSVGALTQTYLMQAPSDEEWLAAVKQSAPALEKPREDARVGVKPAPAHRRTARWRSARPSRPHAPGRHRPSRAPILLGGLAVLVAGASAGAYFAAALPGHGAAKPAASTYTSAGTITVSGDVSSVAFSPNGSQLAGSDGSSIFQWDLATLAAEDILSNPASGDVIIVVAFSPNGKLLASNDGNLVSLWNTATGKVARTYKSTVTSSGPAIGAVAFSPNGSQLAVADGNSVNLWNIATGKVVRTYKPTGISGHAGSGYVSSVTFSPNGTILAAASGNGHTYLWDVATGKPAATFSGDSSVTFSPNGSQLAVADGDSVNLWNIATGKVVRTYKPTGISGHAGSGYVSSVTFSPNGTILAAASGNGHTYLWDVATGKPAATFSGDSSVAFSPNGSQLAVADGNSVNLWNTTTQAAAATFNDPASGGVSWVAFSLGDIASVITYGNVDAVGHPAERDISLYRDP